MQGVGQGSIELVVGGDGKETSTDVLIPAEKILYSADVTIVNLTH